MKIKLGVIFGGETVEHEVSIISAVQAMNNIDEEKYDIIPIYITKDRTWYTGKMLMDINSYKDFNLIKRYAKKVVMYKKNGGYYLQSLGFIKRIIQEVDIVFPIVHGNNCEDGTLQGYLDTIGIPYVGCSVLGAALGQDKVVMKQIFENNNLPVLPYTWFFDTDYFTNKDEIFKEINKIGYPVVVKPASLGSSIGITVVKNENDLDASILEAIKYDTKVIVEQAIKDLIEVNCSVKGNYEYQELSVIEEVMASEEILSYQDKYVSKGKGMSKGMASAGRVIPARISDKQTKEVEELSKKIFRLLNLSGLCRIDYLIDKKTNKIYINEPNTIPGSLAFYLWEPKGKKYKDLLEEMISLAIKDYKKRSKKTFSFETNILQNFNGVKGLKGKLK